MKQTLILISYLLIFSSCINSEKLEGHWHLKNEYSGEIFLSLDLNNDSDSLAYLNKYSFNNTQIVRHYSKEKNLITGECGGYFEYKLDGKKVHLKNVQDYGDYFGKHYELTDSHKLKDYLNNLLVDIVLPKVKNFKKENSLNFENDNFIENLVIGKSKEPYKTEFEESYKIQANERFLKLEEIDNWIEYIKNSTSDLELDFIKFRIVADRDISINLLKTINQKLREKNFERIYLTFIKQNDKRTNELFEYVDLKEINLNEKGKVKDLVNN